MLMKVVVENGVKKLVPLTADAGSGNPCGTIIAIYSNQVPYGYLPCNGVRFDTAQFPVLYAILGDDHTPDLRECVLVGSGQSGRTILDESGHNHDVYTVGQFKDDQLQNHKHYYNDITTTNLDASGQTNAVVKSRSGTVQDVDSSVNPNTARVGTTTHGKQVGVNFCIKATSGINENQADNVLSALTPVNEVALNNLHSVTSNAVAQALSSFIKVKKVTFNNVVLNQNGVLNIESYIPSDINLLFALMWNWGAVSMDNYFGVSGDGRYIRGTPNNTIDWIVVAYFYVD